MLLELENLLLLLGNCLAELADDTVHVLRLSLKLRDYVCLSLLEEDSVNKTPALTSVLKRSQGVSNESTSSTNQILCNNFKRIALNYTKFPLNLLMLLLFLLDLKDLSNER